MTNSQRLSFNDSSATEILRALPQSSVSAALRDFAVNVDEICAMTQLQQLRMADSCRFLSNNLPPRTHGGMRSQLNR